MVTITVGIKLLLLGIAIISLFGFSRSLYSIFHFKSIQEFRTAKEGLGISGSVFVITMSLILIVLQLEL